MTGKIITFYMQEALMGIDIAVVKEVRKKVKYTPVPGAKSCIAGLMNMRGKVVTLFDINKIMGNGHDNMTPGSSCIILKFGYGDNRCAGFLVEKLEDVLDIKDCWCEPPTENMMNFEERFIKELAKLRNGLAAIIDYEKILGECMGINM